MSKFDRRLKRTVAICGITRKRMFRSPNAAMQFVANLGDDCNALTMREFQCLYCGGYHLTSRNYDPSRRFADFRRHQQQRDHQ